MKDMNFDKYDILCFDFDGVICETQNIKTEAYKALFISDYPEKIDEIVDYHVLNSGIIRYVKLKYMCENILGINYTKYLENKLVAEYENLVYQKVLEADYVKGVIDFLEKYYQDKICYIISGTPDKELEKVVEVKKLSKYFTAVYGGSESKSYWLNKIKMENNNRNMVFFGDAYNDFEAAVETNIDFIIRVTDENKVFLNKVKAIEIINDFREII